MIKRFFKNLFYPAGKYVTTDNKRSLKGENKDELFARRDKAIQDRIRSKYPIMRYEDYMKIPTTGTSLRRFQGDPIDDFGAVYDVEANQIKVFRLV